MEFDELSRRVIGCAIEVHRNLGPGLLESTYTGNVWPASYHRRTFHFKWRSLCPFATKKCFWIVVIAST
jgi:hypothetical protein